RLQETCCFLCRRAAMVRRQVERFERSRRIPGLHRAGHGAERTDQRGRDLLALPHHPPHLDRRFADDRMEANVVISLVVEKRPRSALQWSIAMWAGSAPPYAIPGMIT